MYDPESNKVERKLGEFDSFQEALIVYAVRIVMQFNLVAIHSLILLKFYDTTKTLFSGHIQERISLVNFAHVLKSC